MIIICDTSPLIALSMIDKLNLLDELFYQVIVPVSVFDEICIENKPESQRIAHWAKEKVMAAADRRLMNSFNLLLDTGESEAMTLYLERNADFLLIDEKKGRKIAAYNKINIVGSLGVLLLAKQRGLLTSVVSFLNTLQQSYIRISDELYQKTLELAKE